MPSVAIRHPRDPKRPKLIPAERYDPARHALWDDASSVALPDDLPGRDALIRAGVTSMRQLAETKDLATLPGIGEATRTKILAYLARPYGQTGPERPGSALPGAVTPTGPGDGEVAGGD